MKRYKVTFLRIGHVCITAENEEDAVLLAEKIPDADIHWLDAESEEMRRISFAEEISGEAGVGIRENGSNADMDEHSRGRGKGEQKCQIKRRADLGKL